MPSLNRRKRGDLFIRIAVKIPKKLDQRQKTLLEEFASAERSRGSKRGKEFWKKLTK